MRRPQHATAPSLATTTGEQSCGRYTMPRCKIARVLPVDLVALAEVEPGEGAPSQDRARLEGLMAEVAQKLPIDKLRALIEIGRVLGRER